MRCIHAFCYKFYNPSCNKIKPASNVAIMLIASFPEVAIVAAINPATSIIRWICNETTVKAATQPGVMTEIAVTIICS